MNCSLMRSALLYPKRVILQNHIYLEILKMTCEYDFTGAAVKMEHFQAALDPRKQELLEARFLGARVSFLFFLTYFCPFNDI